MKKLSIAIDAMGGDFGLETTISGLYLFSRRRTEAHFLLYGDAQQINEQLSRFPGLVDRVQVKHAPVTISMDEKPSQALRKGKSQSSMWLAIEAVKNKEADIIVSAGNTGALMAMATVCLKTMEKISRPAIAGLWPTLRGESIVLDIGATIDTDARQLVDNALMGAAMARALFSKKQPSVGLLNIGVEDVKGLDEIRQAGKYLRENMLKDIDYIGFVEGSDLGQGKCDVIVTDGFTGNIALKTAEGTAQQVGAYLQRAMRRSLFSRIGYIFAYGAFKFLRERLDPRKVNGGLFLGLNGLVVKSHGGTDGEGFAQALSLAYDMAQEKLGEKITTDIQKIYSSSEHNEVQK